MPTVVILAGAENDTLNLFAKLEARNPDSADEFYRHFEEALQQLGTHSESAQIFAGRIRIRRLVMHGYPFGVFVTVEGERLFVQAVLDLRQSPETIRRRLDDHL